VSRKETGVSSIGMLIIGMIAGAVLMAVFNGLPESVPGNVGSGLKNLVERSQSNTESSEQVAGDAAEDQPGDQVEFDFYEVLPDVGRVMMDDFPVPDAERASNSRKVVYMIQAASLRKESDAEALRARLALAGYESVTQRVNVQDQGTYYRVRIGPYESRRTVKNEIGRLRDIGISAMVVSLDAG
jgi:cell division protein FtsN